MDRKRARHELLGAAFEEEAFAADMMRLLGLVPETDPKELVAMKRVVQRFGDKRTVEACIATRDAVDSGKKIRSRMAYLQAVAKRLDREACEPGGGKALDRKPDKERGCSR